MKTEIKEAWCRKLESGRYVQATHSWGGRTCGKYCCLQLLRQEVLRLKEDGSANTYEDDLYNAGLNASHVNRLMSMNDIQRKTFPEIAQWVRENVPVSP